MKAKLIKTEFGFKLNDLDGIYISSVETGKLSLKNCQAIERGYDLDELADEFAKTKSSHPTFQNTHKRDFREGFHSAFGSLELANKVVQSKKLKSE